MKPKNTFWNSLGEALVSIAEGYEDARKREQAAALKSALSAPKTPMTDRQFENLCTALINAYYHERVSIISQVKDSAYGLSSEQANKLLNRFLINRSDMITLLV